MGGLIAGLGLAGLFVVAFDLVGRLAPGAATRLWAEQPVLGFAAAFVAWDFVGHLYHRIGHGTVLGWAAHRPHHTGTEFALSLAWRQSWLPVHAIVLPLVAIGGWSLSTIVICAAISNVLQAAQHSSAGLNYPAWLVAILMTPQQHRRHHHRTRRRDGREPDREATAVNLGPVLTIWDRIAGSYDPTPVPPDTDYGVGSTTVNPVRLQFEGWTELVALRHNPPTPRRSRDVHPERMPTASTSPAGVAPPG
jgi:sterol desaturase/sphingolipid hydroxylase (fatty acid hydroxylase superfamily)